MKIEIDQSRKIENTNRPTVLAFSNNKNGTLVITAKDKKSIQKYFRSIGKPKLFIYLTFVALVYLLIRNHINSHDQVVIDREYPGYEKFTIQLIKKLLISASNIEGVSISVEQIGRKSKAHDLAWKELKSRIHKNAKKVTYNHVIRIIKKSGSI